MTSTPDLDLDTDLDAILDDGDGQRAGKDQSAPSPRKSRTPRKVSAKKSPTKKTSVRTPRLGAQAREAARARLKTYWAARRKDKAAGPRAAKKKGKKVRVAKAPEVKSPDQLANEAKRRSLVNLQRDFTRQNVEHFMTHRGVHGQGGHFERGKWVTEQIKGYVLTADEYAVCGRMLQAFELADALLDELTQRIGAAS